MHFKSEVKYCTPTQCQKKFNISQGTGQGRILAPFMYKVYINSLLNELTNHCYAISINQLSLPPPHLLMTAYV